MNGKIEENGITQNTKITLPIYLQLVILFAVITVTASTVMGYAYLVGKDERHDEKIELLEQRKLDKSTYDSDKRYSDRESEQLNKKLDAIMKKLNIENF